MDCLRCYGMMVPEIFHDRMGTYVPVQGWRCLTCGNVIDATILRNRVPQSLAQTEVNKVGPCSH